METRSGNSFKTRELSIRQPGTARVTRLHLSPCLQTHVLVTFIPGLFGTGGPRRSTIFRFIPICAVLCSKQREVNITMSASHKWHFYFFVCSDRASCGCGGVSPYAGCEVDGLILWKVLQTLFTFFLSFFH